MFCRQKPHAAGSNGHGVLLPFQQEISARLDINIDQLKYEIVSDDVLFNSHILILFRL